MQVEPAASPSSAVCPHPHPKTGRSWAETSRKSRNHHQCSPQLAPQGLLWGVSHDSSPLWSSVSQTQRLQSLNISQEAYEIQVSVESAVQEPSGCPMDSLHSASLTAMTVKINEAKSSNSEACVIIFLLLFIQCTKQ